MTEQEKRLCSLNFQKKDDFVKQDDKARKLDRQNGMLLPIVLMLLLIAWVVGVEIFKG